MKLLKRLSMINSPVAFSIHIIIATSGLGGNLTKELYTGYRVYRQ